INQYNSKLFYTQHKKNKIQPDNKKPSSCLLWINNCTILKKYNVYFFSALNISKSYATESNANTPFCFHESFCEIYLLNS
ncbi:hypothetical protein FBR96_05515, partial [Campylobacter jejuni]|nr:hypothetical protein [Campylobacter jejuni]